MIEDLRSSLSSVGEPSLEEYRTYALKAVAAFEGGHYEAAQALAGNCITGMIHSLFGLFKFRDAQAKFQKDPMEAGINSFRNWCVQALLYRCLQTFFPEKGDPVPGEFSRHASAHTVSPEQYTEVNSLASLLLLNAFLRETELLSVDEETA